MLRVPVGHGGDQSHFRAVRAQRLDLRGALVVGHHDHGPMAECAAHHCKTDAGISCGALHDHSARAQLPELPGREDHAERGAVFHGASGVQELGLAEDLASRQPGRRVQPQ